MAEIPNQQPFQQKANDILKEPSIPDDKPLDVNQLDFKSMPRGLSGSKQYITPQPTTPPAAMPESVLGEITGSANHPTAANNSLLSSVPVQAAPKSNKNVWIGIIALVVILLAAAGVYFFVLRKPATTEQPLTNPTATTPVATSDTTTDSSTDATTTPAATSILTAAWLTQYFPTQSQNGVCPTTEQSACGDAADPDADGLTNAQEFKLGTDPTLADTDQDGIADGDEANVFGTNPLSAHTSGLSQYTDSADITHMYNSTAKAPFTSADMIRIAAAIKQYGLHAPTTTTLSQATIESYTNYTAPTTVPAPSK